MAGKPVVVGGGVGAGGERGSRNRKSRHHHSLMFAAEHGLPVSIPTVLWNPPQLLPSGVSAQALERRGLSCRMLILAASVRL